MIQVGIIDFGVGNLRSVANAVRHLGANPVLSNDPDELEQADVLIFPGVGAFSYGIQALKERGLDNVINKAAAEEKPVLGICLGMQLLCEASHEFGVHPGLEIISGEVKSLEAVAESTQPARLPNVGWSHLDREQTTTCEHDWLFEGIPPEASFYFIHSFHVSADNSSTIAKSRFGNHLFAAIIGSGSIIGTQFHPEKSGPNGLRMLNNFLNWRKAA